MLLTKKNLIVGIAVSFSSIAYAAEYWTADIRVNSINMTTTNQQYSCSTVIASSNDDARNAKAFITLSPDLKFNSFSISNLNSNKPNDGKNAACNASRATGRLSGIAANGQSSYIECKLGHLSTHAKLKITIKGMMLRSTKFKPACAVFVMSSTPDHKFGNNFKATR